MPQTTPLDLNPILTAIDEFEAAGKRLDDSATRALASGAIDPKLAATINHGAMQVERNWLNPDGIPGRPWFKHILYGARFTYAHLELPGLTEAVEKQDWPTANQQAEILRQALVNNTKLVDDLDSDLNGGSPPGKITRKDATTCYAGCKTPGRPEHFSSRNNRKSRSRCNNSCLPCRQKVAIRQSMVLRTVYPRWRNSR